MNCKYCLYRFNCYIHLNDNEICEKYTQAQNQEGEIETDESGGIVMTPEDALDMLYCQLIDLIDDASFDVDRNQMKEYYNIVEKALRETYQLEKAYQNILNSNCECTYQLLKHTKELKALAIIKQKDVNIFALKLSESLEQYNRFVSIEDAIKYEEYMLLKEVLK